MQNQEAVGAQRNAVQRSQGTINPAAVAALALCGALLAGAREARAAAPGSSGTSTVAGKSSISGIVRDAQGVAQMGALVQVLAADSMTVATAFTDQRGRYSIANLIPGRYLVRASATLFVPVTRSNLQLRNGANSVVNLTLATLFDTASWLPAERRRADESDEDWKWTLRSTANRPILRMVENGEEIEVSSSASEVRPPELMQARGAIESGDGEFGQGGVHTILTLHRALDDGSEMTLRADFGSAAAGEAAASRVATDTPAASAVGSEYALGYESRTGFNGGASRTLVTYKSHPELVSGNGAGYEVMQMTSAQRMALGERVEVEAGGRLDAIRTSSTAFAAHPFLRLSAHPAGAWSLQYLFATDRGLQSFGDITDGPGDIPVALVRDGHLLLESGHHQEIAVARSGASGAVQIALFRDESHQTPLSGGEAASAPAGGPAALVPTGVPEAMLLDAATGSFRALGPGYAANGFRITASSPLTGGLWVAAEYSAGESLTAPAVTRRGCRQLRAGTRFAAGGSVGERDAGTQGPAHPHGNAGAGLLPLAARAWRHGGRPLLRLRRSGLPELPHPSAPPLARPPAVGHGRHHRRHQPARAGLPALPVS